MLSAIRSTPSAAWFHASFAGVRSAVTCALLASDTCNAPSERCQAIQVSTVPNARSSARERSGSTASRIDSTFSALEVRGEAVAVGPQLEAPTDDAEVLPPLPGRDGLTRAPVPDDRRRTLVGDADRVDRTGVGEAAAREVEGDARHRGGVELDQPGRRRVGEQRGAVLDDDPHAGVDHGAAHRRRPDVDDEDPASGCVAHLRTRGFSNARCTCVARTRCLEGEQTQPEEAHGQAGLGPNGLGRPSFPGLRMPLGSSAPFTAASTSRPSPSASRTKRARLSPTP